MRKSFAPRASRLDAMGSNFGPPYCGPVRSGVCQVVGGQPPPASLAHSSLVRACRASFEAEFNLIPLNRSPETGAGHCMASNWFGRSRLARSRAALELADAYRAHRTAVSVVQQSSNLMAPRRGFSRDGAAGKLMASWRA